MNIDLRHGDCRTVMATMEPESVDAIVTDPPYGLNFMGKEWDHGVPGVTFWVEALRVAKPGAHLLAFGGTRTFHRLACAIEDAGWEIRDCIMWVYGSGFPKSHDVSKAIDKAARTEREKVPATGELHKNKNLNDDEWSKIGDNSAVMDSCVPVTDAARQWSGWGTALKPAWEPIIVARKPLVGTVAENVLQYGTGAINVDRCRVGTDVVTINTWDDGAKPFGGGAGHTYSQRKVQGRWPANVAHDGSDDVVGLFPVTTSGALKAGHKQGSGMFGRIDGETILREYGGDTNSAARFFYCAKTSNRDRNDGCDNPHPTVKPTELMTWLCRLVTPPNGVVLDPFCGSGSTGRGGIHVGAAQFIGIDISEDYLEIARRRIEAARHPMDSLLS